MEILGHINHQVRAIDEKASTKTSDSGKGSREKGGVNEEKSIGSMHQLFQNPDALKVDESLLGSNI